MRPRLARFRAGGAPRCRSRWDNSKKRRPRRTGRRNQAQRRRLRAGDAAGAMMGSDETGEALSGGRHPAARRAGWRGGPAGGEFLIVRRPDDPDDPLAGVWGLPAITLLDGEDERAAVARAGR